MDINPVKKTYNDEKSRQWSIGIGIPEVGDGSFLITGPKMYYKSMALRGRVCFFNNFRHEGSVGDNRGDGRPWPDIEMSDVSGI